MGTIKAVIFDMDGVIIDSEPFWLEAQTQAFERAGLRFTPEMYLETMGRRVDEVVDYWQRKVNARQWCSNDLKEQIVQGVIDRVLHRGQVKEGVQHALQFFETKGLKVALASSSVNRIIASVLERLRLPHRFSLAYSAEDEQFGKPHPGVYLTCAQRLGVSPFECLAIEDSFTGVLAAKAARMRCAAVPDGASRNDPRFCIADARLESLADVDDAVLN